MITWALTVAGFLIVLIAVVFLGFSDYIMRGLAQAPGTAGLTYRATNKNC